MTLKKGQYHYGIKGRFYVIYQCVEATDTGSHSVPVQGEPSYTDPQAARRRVYQLNGWKWRH
ncbi:hypothetical protein [Paramuribaculum intestinale]|uniref:hypothetical protein n=1 Tax=Paramuribaculum intestinale TaxID=2094151 RepID=UPI0025A9B39D|nr:hypothetical protein [Paramuribaculum intestinale]